MSCRLNVQKFKRKIIWTIAGGSIGRLEISGGRQLRPVLQVFKRLAMSCEDELEIFNKMGGIQFEEDRMILNPKSE